MSPRKEINVPKLVSLENLGKLIASNFPEVLEENVTLARIYKMTNFKRGDLVGEKWWRTANNKARLKEQPFYLSNDGHMMM